MDATWFDDNFFELGSYVVKPRSNTVIFCKGGKVEKTLDASVVPQRCIFVKDFYHDTFTYHRHDEITELDLNEILEVLKSRDLRHMRFSPIDNYDEEVKSDFKLFHDAVLAGAVQKVVLASRARYQPQAYSLSHLCSMILKSLTVSGSYGYGFWNEQRGILGATPERLISFYDHRLTADAVAGTRAIDHGENEIDSVKQLMLSSKDLYEHYLVEKELKEKFDKYNYQATVSDVSVKKFLNIVHLYSRLSAPVNLDDRLSLPKLAQYFSPSAALGGYPSHKAMDLMRHSLFYKRHPDRLFGSVIGFNDHHGELYVMIRNIQWKNGNFFIDTGAGLVAKSCLEKELAEILLKRNATVKLYAQT